MRTVLLLAALALLLFGAPPKAVAQDRPRVIGEFSDWTAIRFREDGETVCWISSEPLESEPKDVRRGDIYVLVTHRSASKTTDEVSVYVGYPLRTGSEALIDIGGREFKMFTDGQTAWAYDADADKALVRAMIRGSSTDEVSVYVGYPLRTGSEALIDIGGREFKMFTDGQTAWAYDADADKALSMVIRGTSQRGTETVDRYSLRGFTAARSAINQACAAE